MLDQFGGLSTIDYGIVAAYFVATLLAGVYFSKKASQGISNYFLGGRKVPWWAIGMSGTASNFDMTGTMVIISFFFAIGLQGYWVSMRGGMGLPLGILMIFMGKWLRRSNVMTTAEWMELRFGREREGDIARLLSAVSNLIVTVAFLVYFVKGTGKFLSIFLPFEPWVCSMLMIAVAITYTAASGFYGVIYTDVLQEILILGVSIYVGYMAFSLDNHAEVMQFAGDQWATFIPQWEAPSMGWLDNPMLYQAFGLCIVFWIARGIFEGMGGFTGGYMTQRYYAARNDREASLLTAEWILLIMFRWALIIGVVLLGMALAYQNPEIAAYLNDDPEKTLPVVLANSIPAGLRGILVAGLIAAAMSTFDSTVNAGTSYWIRDIYQKIINPKASQKQLMRQSYIGTFALAALSVLIAFGIKNINEIWSWITGPLSAGLFAPIIMRWYWWRFNGYGFAIATGVGLATSIVIKAGFPELAFYWGFITTMIASLLGGIVGSLATPATPQGTLQAFWKRIRPFGFWGKVRNQIDEELVRTTRLKNSIDLLNIFYAISWHLSGVVASISLILHKWKTFGFSISLFAALSVLLYFTWYKNLQSKEEGEKEALEELS